MDLLQHKCVKQWLSDKKPSSKKQYLFYFGKFLEFHNLNPTQFLEEAKKDKVEAKTKINEFYRHLRDNGATLTYAKVNDATVKSFLSYHEIPIKTKKRIVRRKYDREILRRSDIKKIIESATQMRDKALIILAFQTGMSISDLLKLNYGHVKEVLENETKGISVIDKENDKEKEVFFENIGMIRYIREKTETEGFSIFGEDSITILEKYLNWRKQKGETLTDESPLFIAIRKKQRDRLSIRSTQRLIRDAIVKAGITTFHDLKESKTVNPYGFHAIRKAFCSIAEQYGMPKSQVEMSLGHKLDYDSAYKGFTDEEKILNYQKVERYLSIYSMEQELEEKTEEHDETIEELQKKLEAKDQELRDLKEYVDAKLEVYREFIESQMVVGKQK